MGVVVQLFSERSVIDKVGDALYSLGYPYQLKSYMSSSKMYAEVQILNARGCARSISLNEATNGGLYVQWWNDRTAEWIYAFGVDSVPVNLKSEIEGLLNKAEEVLL